MWTIQTWSLVLALQLAHVSPSSAREKRQLHFRFPEATPGETRVEEASRCSRVKDLTLFADRFACGSPLTEPCFDFGRCSTTSAGLYVHDANCSLSDSSTMLAADGTGFGQEKEDPHYIGWVFRNAAREAGVLADSYGSACVILHINRVNDEPCATRSPLWNNGVNHVMVDFGDWGMKRHPTIARSFAMDAASNIPPCMYRSGYDVSLPLAPKKTFHGLAEIAPLDRAFFLTFKGTVYLSDRGSEERMSIAPLHDEEHGVVVSVHCFEMHGEHLLPENVEYCQSLKTIDKEYDYRDLMETTFGLVPAGRSPATYRLAEVMSAGAIPVMVARDFVHPFREHFDWPSFSFTFAPDQVGPYMMNVLRSVPEVQLEKMQRLSLEAHREMFGDGHDHQLLGPRAYGPIARKVVEITMQRIGHRGGR